MTETILPRAVALNYGTFDDGCYVDVHDARTHDLITSDTLHNIGDWLAVLGYRWRFGSNGIWERKR